MAQPKKFPINFVIILALLGAVLASWVAPKAISWYFDPPVNIGVNCREATVWSMHKLQVAQLVGLILGAIAGLVGAVAWVRRNGEDA